MVVTRMIVPARFRKIMARCHRPMQRGRSTRGIWYLGSSIMKPPPPPLATVRRSTQRGDQRADDAGDVEAEHHQPLQADAGSRRRGRG